MPRRGSVKKRKVVSDAVYESELVTRLINRSMKDGKKSVAEKQVYGAFNLIKKKTKKNPLKIFEAALEKIKPLMEVRPRRVGGAAYQVPMPVKGDRRISLAIRWLIFAARARANRDYHTYAEKLAAEIIDASNEEGGAVKKKQEMERMAEANRAFAHFRW
jgi:small subunit ribosomal protein S7